jgi:hypothetical protein
MAKSENNEVMFGARGRIGHLVVFKNFGTNETVISKRRKKPVNPVYSEDQEAAKEKFRAGVVYAKGVKESPELLAIYQAHAKPGRSAYNLALADFCRPTEISVIDYTAYKGMAGDQIRVRAKDNFAVVSVNVSIYNAKNELVETGPAAIGPNKLDWYYQVTAPNASLKGTTIKAETNNLPGNPTVAEVKIS